MSLLQPKDTICCRARDAVEYESGQSYSSFFSDNDVICMELDIDYEVEHLLNIEVGHKLIRAQFLQTWCDKYFVRFLVLAGSDGGTIIPPLLFDYNITVMRMNLRLRVC
jgi:hypothetical protein